MKRIKLTKNIVWLREKIKVLEIFCKISLDLLCNTVNIIIYILS